ncbi:MAG: adenylate/guanylate cyclase domain-containing protein [Flavisolibacter sp.]
MARISLNNIIGKNKTTASLFAAIIGQVNADAWIEDEKGRLLYGTKGEIKFEHPIVLEEEVLGWVKGDERSRMIADLLTQFLQKEAEKKKLGSEVLNLYQEINLIFDFSEKLAKTIDAPAICNITLNEASRVIKSDNGVIILWDELSQKLSVTASSGEQFFNPTKINNNVQLLSKIVISGQSEIITDTTSLTEAGIVLPGVRSIIYSALKVKHRVMGAIILASTEAVQYTAADLKLLTTLALQSSGSIESALLYEKNIREVKEREDALRHVYEATAKFVPYEFIGSLGHKVITDVRLGDHVEKIVTVLFSDIRDYTTLSEKMSPEENFSFVCSFNERMGPIIRKNNGFINQYLGDAIMAIFPLNAADALQAAIEMQMALEELNEVGKLANLSSIRIGIGMHTGPLIMGITGDHNRLDATTISDTVNTASRIESLTKYYKSGIIISDSSLQQIKETNAFHLRNLGLVQLKGKQEAIGIHECFSGNRQEELQNKLSTLTLFNEGMKYYSNRSFVNARKAFGEVLEIHANDRTAQFFYEKTEELIASGNSEHWVGVIEMQEK